MKKNDIIRFCLTSNLYGTIISDVYSNEEKEEIVQALEKVCNRTEYYSFDKIGVYFYWDYDTREILYIGLTNDLKRRFKEHNGLVENVNTGNKFKKIQEYFKNKEKLGFSILVQSPLSHKDYQIFDKTEEVRIIEGAFIESFKKIEGEYPSWNECGGSKFGREDIFLERYTTILKSISLKEITEFNAKSTLREIAKSEKILMNESNLHAIRMMMYKYSLDFFGATAIFMENLSNLANSGSMVAFNHFHAFEKLINSEYMNKKLKI